MSHTHTMNESGPGGIIQLALDFWSSKTLLSAVELGVFTAVGRGPLEVK